MSGVAVIRSLLATSAGLIAEVPATRIMAGALPLNTVLPAIQIEQISSVRTFLPIAMTGTNRMHTDRVQVTVMVKASEAYPAGEYGALRTILALVLAACPNQNGTVNGVTVDSILPDIEGPDLADVAAGIYTASRDFMVKWKSA